MRVVESEAAKVVQKGLEEKRKRLQELENGDPLTEAELVLAQETIEMLRESRALRRDDTPESVARDLLRANISADQRLIAHTDGAYRNSR